MRTTRTLRNPAERGCTLLALFLIASLPIAAQQFTAAPAFDPQTWLKANQRFEIRLEGQDVPRAGVLIDQLDVTALFDRVGPSSISYRGEGPPLPSGQRLLSVYAIDDSGSWTPIGQFPIRILDRRGFQKVSVTPTANLTGKGQVGEEHSPDSNAPPRDEFEDGTMQLAIRTELVRPSFTIRADGQVAGVTYQNEALRFGTAGEDAPKVDLSSYRIDLERGSTLLSLGHVGYGGFRHLANGVQSRGLSLTLGNQRRISLQLAAMNGSSIVGWDNFMGLANSDHQLWGATLGMESFPSSPGLLRFEYGGFRGSLQPFTGFNQSAVVTSETSTGGTMRVLSADPSGRWRLDAGWTTSEFETATDDEVEGGLTVTPIQTKRNEAWYLDASIGLVRNRQVGSQPANVSLNLRYENVEPLFRSVGAFAQSDIRSWGGDLLVSHGSASGMLTHTRTNDNLAGLDSLLTSLTQRTALNLSLPLGSMLSPSAPPRWAPILSLQADTIHQFGDGVPQGGDFSIENVPDMLSWNALLSAEWQLGVWRIGGRLGANEQDNRQIGSENADFETMNYTLLAGWAPNPKLSINAEVGLDSTDNIGGGTTNNALRWLGGVNWNFWRQAAVSATITNNRSWDDLDTREQENLDGFFELSSGFSFPGAKDSGRGGRIFLRWTNQRSQLRDDLSGFSDERDSSTITTGITLNLS